MNGALAACGPGADGCVRGAQFLREGLRGGGSKNNHLDAGPEPAGRFDGLRRGGLQFVGVVQLGVVLAALKNKDVGDEARVPGDFAQPDFVFPSRLVLRPSAPRETGSARTVDVGGVPERAGNNVRPPLVLPGCTHPGGVRITKNQEDGLRGKLDPQPGGSRSGSPGSSSRGRWRGRERGSRRRSSSRRRHRSGRHRAGGFHPGPADSSGQELPRQKQPLPAQRVHRI